MKKVLYITADWCTHCKALEPTMNRLKANIPVETINADYESDRISAMGVKSIPTVILVDGETEIKRLTGNRTYEQMLDFIK